MIDYDKVLSAKVTGMKPSGIRRFFDIAGTMSDVVSLGVGEPDFKTPFIIRQAGVNSLERGHTWYTSNSGLTELRQEIVKYQKRRFSLDYDAMSETVVTVGGSEAIDIAIRAFINEGDEVIIPEPSFVCYNPIVSLSGGVPVPIATKAKDNFRLTADDLKAAITDRTKLLILPFPNNPTGAVMRREHLEAIADVIKGTNIMILSDEIYAELTYGDERHCSIATLDGMRERCVVIGGFSKSHAMTGWRLGYALAPAEITYQMLKIHQYAIMCAPTTSQYAAITALAEGDDEVERMAKEYDMRRRFITDGFNRLGLTCFKPEGAFYVFPSIQSTGLTSEEFCTRLIKTQKVAVVPGTAFGDSGEGFVRVSYSYSLQHIKEALKRIEEFCRNL